MVVSTESCVPQRRVSYRRIPTGLPHTDPFSGTYLASFGPHGVEMLLLTRKMDKGGHEIVTARKLTGALLGRQL